MIRKILALLNFLFAALSFYVVAIRLEWGTLYWILSSTGPFLFFAAIAVFFKIRSLQALLLPALLFFGLGALVSYKFSMETLFALMSATLMIVSAGYIIARHLMKLVVIRLVLRFLMGTLLLVSFLLIRERLIPEPELREVTTAEINIFKR